MSVSDAFGMTHVFLPPADAATSPALLLLHGTGGDEHDLVPLAQELLSGAAILSPRGTVSENGMNRFFRRLSPGVFDVKDLHERTRELDTFLHDASAHHGFALSKTIAVGYSNGANIAASLMLLHPETLHSAVLLHGMLPFEPEELPSLRKSRVFLSIGERDQMIPPESSEALAELLQKAGARVTVQRGPGGHEIGGEEIAAAREWLRS